MKQKAVQKLEEAHRKEKVEKMTRARRAQFSEVNGKNLRLLQEEMDQIQAEKAAAHDPHQPSCMHPPSRLGCCRSSACARARSWISACCSVSSRR